MHTILFLNRLPSEQEVQELLGKHPNLVPAVASCEIETEVDESHRSTIEQLFHQARNTWDGLENISLIVGAGKSNHSQLTVGVSSTSSETFSHYVADSLIQRLKKIILEGADDSSSDDDIEEFRVNSDLVQICEGNTTVNGWTDSFIKSRRDLINSMNIRDFSLAQDHRLDCARVDAIFSKRKDTSSHINVQSVKNLWGPQVVLANDKKIPFDDHKEAPPVPSKKTYSLTDLEDKLKHLKGNLRTGSEDSSF